MSISLPKNIDYTVYYGDGGGATKMWGKSCWDFLFTTIICRYPVKIDLRKKEDKILQKTFKNLLLNLKIVLPCIYCRNSFKDFVDELPIDKFLVGRIELMYWLYLIKDKVNNKLIKQERNCYNREKKRLKTLYHKNEINESEYYDMVKQFKEKTFVTIKTPHFKEVLDKYENYRAVCSPISKTCVKKQ